MAPSYRRAMDSTHWSRGTSPSRSFWLTLPQSTMRMLRLRLPSTTHSPYSMFTSSSQSTGPLLSRYSSQVGPVVSVSGRPSWSRF